MRHCLQTSDTSILAAIGFFCAITIAEAAAPDIVWKTNGHNMEVTSLAFAPDGTSLASGTRSDGFDGHVRVWRVQDIALVKSFTLFQEDVFSLAFSPDGNYLAEGGGGATLTTER